MFQQLICEFLREGSRGEVHGGFPCTGVQGWRGEQVFPCLPRSRCHRCLRFHVYQLSLAKLNVEYNLQLSAMNVSVRSTMKGAAKCDKHCELQNSVNRQGLERILCFWDIPESMPASVSMLYCSSVMCCVVDLVAVIACASGRALWHL